MKRAFVIHPFLFAIHPILCLFAVNFGEFSPREIAIPIILFTCFTLILWLLLSFLTKNRQKAGLFLSLEMLLFFSLGPLCRMAYAITDSRALNDILLLTWSILLVLVAYGSLRIHKYLQLLTRLLNAISVFMVATSVIYIGVNYFKSITALNVVKGIEDTKLKFEESEKSANLPNIYYIILDGYARGDVLEELYQYNNSEFLDYLDHKGFYVAGKSRSNYAQTVLSLASSLNFEYLNDLEIDTEYGNRLPLVKMIRENRLVRLLKQHGYTFVAFSSGCSLTEITCADMYIRTGHLGMFGNALISSILPPSLAGGSRMQYNIHRKSILYTFERLAKISESNVPIFVFAHILAPHPPFVFGEHGEERTPNKIFWFRDGNHFINHKETTRNEYRRDYISQLRFISERIKALINDILSKSDKPPIIILQADHGPGSMLDWEDPNNTYIKERMAILNAYYLPDNGHKLLYDEITPINTFRVISNQYLGTNFDQLQDKCYFSTWNHPYKFIDVTKETSGDR